MRRFLLMCAAVLPAAPALGAAPILIPTNLPGVAAVAPPPPGFDPVRATPDELETYGFPARPSPLYRSAYAAWVRAMQSARVRIVPVLHETDHVEGLALHVAAPGLPGTLYSKNWSGFVTLNGTGSFGASSFSKASAVFEVPIAEPAFGTCGTGVHVSTWVGIDGWQSNAHDILQAGTESDNYCTNGNSSSYYYAWYEFLPNNQVNIGNLPISPGDVITVYIQALNATTGSVLVLNATTNQYVSLNVSAPGGTQLVGNSVEWIVERPTIGNNLSTLANYVTTWISSTGAAINGAWFNYATPPAGSTPYNVIMVDNSGSTISTPTGLYPNGIVLNDSGSAK